MATFLRRARRARGFPLPEEATSEELLTHLNLLDAGRPTRLGEVLTGESSGEKFDPIPLQGQSSDIVVLSDPGESGPRPGLPYPMAPSPPWGRRRFWGLTFGLPPPPSGRQPLSPVSLPSLRSLRPLR